MSKAADNLILVRAKLADLAAVAGPGAAFYAEGKLPGKFIPDVFVKTWAGLLASGAGAIFCLMAGGVCNGAIGGVLYNDPNDGELVATDFFWFVKPEHRGGHGLRLLGLFEGWASASGAKRILMVHLATLQPEVLGKLYERRGYRKTETIYVKET